eukprot:COSAG06_NODE_7503_length_2482_cov_2.049937_3_plen_89_part_00
MGFEIRLSDRTWWYPEEKLQRLLDNISEIKTEAAAHPQRPTYESIPLHSRISAVQLYTSQQQVELLVQLSLQHFVRPLPRGSSIAAAC